MSDKEDGFLALAGLTVGGLVAKYAISHADEMAAALTVPVSVTAAAGVTVSGVLLRRRYGRRQRRFIRPTVRVIESYINEPQARVRLKVHGRITSPPRQMSPTEIAVRRWYTAHLEPAVRWLPDRAMRAWWLVAKPVGRVVALLRPVDPPRVKLTIHKMRSPYLDEDRKAQVKNAVQEKIPLGDTHLSWNQHGWGVRGTWTVKRRPPQHVDLAALEAAFPKLADHEFFTGHDNADQPYIVSLEDDSPHIACSAGSGAGKSVLAMLLAIQVLRRGGRVVILDRKGSHRWAKPLIGQGVTYCRKPQEMHDALVKLSDDAWGNQDVGFDSDDDGWTPDDRVMVIAEELNATFSWLRRYWSQIKEKGDTGPSPAAEAFKDLLYTGRSAHHHVFAVAQMLSANTVGGPEARENFGVRALARFSANNWKMLAAGVPMPHRSRVRGRWQFVVGDETTEVQVAFLTAAQAQAFTGVPLRKGGGSYDSLTSKVPGDRGSIGDIVDPLSEPITLRDAVDEGLFVTYEAAKKRLQRASGRVPQRVGKRVLADLYRRGDLIELAEQRATQGEK